MKICPKCNNNHEKLGIFCSRGCANSRIRTKEIKDSISLKLKGRKVGAALTNAPDPAKWEQRYCKKCNKVFSCYKKSTKTLCGIKCSGGYREKSGRGKSGTYKGIFCNSTYELAWVIYRLDHDLPVKRFKGYLTDGVIKYYPDFIIDDNTIIEIKGYHTPEVDRKTQLAKDKGYNIQLLYRQDLHHCFDWIKTQYGIVKLEKMYETLD